MKNLLFVTALFALMFSGCDDQPVTVEKALESPMFEAGAQGYDHVFVLDGQGDPVTPHAAWYYHPDTLHADSFEYDLLPQCPGAEQVSFVGPLGAPMMVVTSKTPGYFLWSPTSGGTMTGASPPSAQYASPFDYLAAYQPQISDVDCPTY